MFVQKLEWNSQRCHGCLKAYQVLWFDGGGHMHTSVMCMLVVVHVKCLWLMQVC